MAAQFKAQMKVGEFVKNANVESIRLFHRAIEDEKRIAQTKLFRKDFLGDSSFAIFVDNLMSDRALIGSNNALRGQYSEELANFLLAFF